MATRSFQLAKILGSGGTIKAAALDSDAVGGGVKLAENDSADLGTGAAGDLKFASNRKTLHMYDGTEWERIAGGQDADPVVITDAADATVSGASTDSHRQTFKVVDPEGFPISYSISYMRDSDKVFFTNDSSNLPPPLAHPAIITKATDGTATYRFLTRTTESDGSGYTTKDLYKARYMGSDGARQVVSTKDFSLAFSPADPILFSASGTSWAQDWSSNDAYFNNSVNGVSLTTYMNNSGVQAYRSNALKVGNYYFEVDMRGNDRINSPTSGGLFPEGGLGLYGGTASTWGFNSTGLVFMGSTATGNWGYISAPSYNASDRSNNSPPQFSAPEGRIIHYAYNSTTRKAWIGTSDDGTSIGWSTVGGVPGVGTGYNLGGSAGGDIVFAFGGSSNVTTSQFKGYFRTGNRILGTAPAGYSNY